ncbi:MAG: DUF1772 domain-containing protein [Aridibacter famidurans]|nr:DUF1772 domain-containing protein [Aridibacter famidurans]
MLDLILIITALFVSLVAGFLFAFAVVVMPGIGKMDDLRFAESFKAIDSVIQDNNPLFILVWVGSGVGAVASAVAGFLYLQGPVLALVSAACALVILAVHVPTVVVNVPLNNRLQGMDLGQASDSKLGEIRSLFERRWLFWNNVRTLASIAAAILLMAGIAWAEQ